MNNTYLRLCDGVSEHINQRLAFVEDRLSLKDRVSNRLSIRLCNRITKGSKAGFAEGSEYGFEKKWGRHEEDAIQLEREALRQFQRDSS